MAARLLRDAHNVCFRRMRKCPTEPPKAITRCAPPCPAVCFAIVPATVSSYRYGQDDTRTVNDPHRALDIDLDGPVDAMDMLLPTASHHVASGLTRTAGSGSKGWPPSHCRLSGCS